MALSVSRLNHIARSLGLIATMTALVLGATYAVTNHADLTGVTFAMNADLQISLRNSTQDRFWSTQLNGFDFTSGGDQLHLGQPSDPKFIYLRKGPSAPALSGIQVSAPDYSAPGSIFDGTDTNPAHIMITITNLANNQTASSTLANLASQAMVIPGDPGTTPTKYKIVLTVNSSDYSPTVLVDPGFELDFAGQ